MRVVECSDPSRLYRQPWKRQYSSGARPWTSWNGSSSHSILLPRCGQTLCIALITPSLPRTRMIEVFRNASSRVK